MRIETKIYKCYLVEIVGDNTEQYYKSELCFGTLREAKELEKQLISEALRCNADQQSDTTCCTCSP